MQLHDKQLFRIKKQHKIDFKIGFKALLLVGYDVFREKRPP